MVKSVISAILALLLMAAAMPAWAEEIAGDWIGEMESGFKVRLQMEKADTGYSGRLINASGNVTAIDRIESDGKALHFAVTALKLSYGGVWDEAQKIWDGKLTFQGVHALRLRRASVAELAPKTVRRPQEAAILAGPLPYDAREVHFVNPAGGHRLAGTLTVPRSEGPFPVAVLIAGTGRNTRDEEAAGHKVFLVLADALTRQGIAVLRYDKRGVAESGGDYAMATTADFASDADAAVAFIKGQAGFDPKRIGVVGHSEGGVIAPMVAVNRGDLAFVVMMAGPGVRGDQIFLLQSAATSRLYGVPEDYIARRQQFDRTLYEAVLLAPDGVAAKARAEAVIAQGVADGIVDATEADALRRDTTTPWQRFFMAYDPAPVLRRLKTPVLVLNGGLDVQVTPRENLAAIREALVAHSDATVLELPGLNHLFQTAVTGSPQEYGDIDETIAPSALKVIADWIEVRVR